MKEILKALAVSLPAEMNARYDEPEDALVVKGELIYANGTPVESAAGATVLLQFIESQGWSWETGKSIGGDTYFCQIRESDGMRAPISFGFCPSVAEAAAKAALEVAGRMK
jgi:hypothetical protein